MAKLCLCILVTCERVGPKSFNQQSKIDNVMVSPITHQFHQMKPRWNKKNIRFLSQREWKMSFSPKKLLFAWTCTGLTYSLCDVHHFSTSRFLMDRGLRSHTKASSLSVCICCLTSSSSLLLYSGTSPHPSLSHHREHCPEQTEDAVMTHLKRQIAMRAASDIEGGYNKGPGESLEVL